MDPATPSELLGYALAIGAGATAFIDLWAFIQTHVFGARAANLGFLGRWIGHLVRGQLRHDAIADAPPVRGETFIGWVAHYAIGIVFAALLLGIWGVEWARNPTAGPALLLGVATVVFPYFVLQPALGSGIAASRMPQPNFVRLRSLLTHTLFGVGLYLAALAIAAFR